MLTIQKLVLLTQNKQLNEFKKYLDENAFKLPLQLIEQIERYGVEQPDSQVLCVKIYGDTTEKTRKKFFQLAHFTFGLSAFLSRRYPNYLQHNLLKINELITAGKTQDALFFTEILLDLAEKTEDYNTLLPVLKLYSAYEVALEKRSQAIKNLEKLNEYTQYELSVNEILLYIRKNLNFKDKKTITQPNTQKHIRYFEQYYKHPSAAVRILARYGACFTSSFLDDKNYYTPEVKQQLYALIKELEKNSFVIIPYVDDIFINIDYLNLKHVIHTLSQEEVQKEAMRFTKKWNQLRFWATHLNTAEIVSLGIQASYFLTNYCITYKEDYRYKIPEAARIGIDEAIKLCEKTLKQIENTQNHVKFISINNIYCALLLLSGKESIQKAVKIIEGLLINYQQIPFQKLYDSLFVNLLIGYFSLGKYNEVIECYRRYEKLTSGKAKIEENDLTIKGFYYVTQWLLTEREQYKDKLQEILWHAQLKQQLTPTYKILKELCAYYSVNIASV
jgi:hypothetical protein